MQGKIIITSVAILLIASPIAAAWGMKGGYEPDTKRDATDGWMWPTADTTPCGDVAVGHHCVTEHVYLNGYLGQCAEACTDVNPNVATVRTATFTADHNFHALFGVWKDCNNDGFVGLGDQGIWDYKEELLALNPVGPGLTICPVQGTNPADFTPNGAGVWPNGNWYPVHNDGKWIREFIPIGWSNAQSVTGDQNPWDLNDPTARVWADYALPEEDYLPTCPLIPVEHGTFGSVGGLLHTFDCREGYTVTDALDAQAASNPALAPFSFADHPRDQQNSNSQANVKNPWGQPNDASMYQVWDCNTPSPIPASPFPTLIGDKRDGTGHNSAPNAPSYHVVSLGNDPALGNYYQINVSMPLVPPSTSVNPAGSPAGTVNALGSGFDQCHTPQGADDHNGAAPQGLIFDNSDDNFHPGKSTANAPYMLEYDVASTPARVTPDDWLAYCTPTTNAACGDSYPHTPWDQAQAAGNKDWPALVGLQATANIGSWAGTHQWTNPFILQRYTLQTGPVYHTFYGYTSIAGTAKGATAKYGADGCGGFVSGVHKGWQCASSLWWRDSQNTDLKSSARSMALGPLNCSSTTTCGFYGATVGDLYNVRDIDCYDESFDTARANGVGYGIEDGKSCNMAP